MRTWRSKLISLLIVYFAGFATAIYCLAPAPDNYSSQNVEKNFAFSALKSDEFAQSFNSAMHKCLDLSKDAALRVAQLIKQKLDERQQQAKQ